MDTEFGFVPLPDEDTEAYRAFELCEECNVMACRGDAPDPYAAADAYSNEAWSPGALRPLRCAYAMGGKEG